LRESFWPFPTLMYSLIIEYMSQMLHIYYEAKKSVLQGPRLLCARTLMYTDI
jgi:hypothetical protein